MNLLFRTAITLSVCLASASTALAQPATPGDTLCGLYKQAADSGKEAFVAFRGKELAKDTWALKDVVVEGGTCIVRSNLKKKSELLGCSFESASADAAKKWVDDMAAATRTCVTGLTGFVEKKGAAEEADDKDRIGWIRKTDAGTLRIGLSVFVKDDKAFNLVSVRFKREVLTSGDCVNSLAWVQPPPCWSANWMPAWVSAMACCTSCIAVSRWPPLFGVDSLSDASAS